MVAKEILSSWEPMSNFVVMLTSNERYATSVSLNVGRNTLTSDRNLRTTREARSSATEQMLAKNGKRTTERNCTLTQIKIHRLQSTAPWDLL